MQKDASAPVNTPQKEWFNEWFDSPYYHILYQNRDEAEARNFIDRLLGKLSPEPGNEVLDLACGKGRYSRHLAGHGLYVTGLDLSEKSIRYARQFETDHLSFFTHDMRHAFCANRFDLVFSFFTSFGYFDNDADHLKTFKNVATSLKSGGRFVLDFFNAQYIKDHLVAQESKEIEGIDFHLAKEIAGDYVVKSIDFEDAGQHWHFEERVRLFNSEDFESLLSRSGMQLLQVFGDYKLGEFDRTNSPRFILIAQKS